MNETCDSIENCGPDPISFASKEAICKEGSLTVLLALFFIGLSFAIVQVIHHLRVDKLQVKGLYDKVEKKSGNLASKAGKSIVNVIEEIFVKPFVPTSLEGFVVGIFFAWFCLTIPIALSRYYEKEWKQLQITIQGPLNLISWAVGCEGFDMNILTYTPSLDPLPHPFKKQNIFKKVVKIFRRKRKVIDTVAVDPAMEHYKEVDWVFTVHLIFALIWLTSGFFQIFMIKAGWSTKRDLRVLSHRWFGRIVAAPSVIAHLFFATRTAFKNPVNQIPVITMVYLCTTFTCLVQLWFGWRYAYKAYKLSKAIPPEERTKEYEENIKYLRNLHRARMGILYIGSISGSGAIRIAVWTQWIFGKFFSRKTRMRICRGFCQTYSYQLGLSKRKLMGDSDYCWEAVFINLLLMNTINAWLQWLYHCMLKRDKELVKSDEDAMKIKANSFFQSITSFLVLLIIESSDLLYSETVQTLIKFGMYYFVFFVQLDAIHQGIAKEIALGRKKPPEELTYVQYVAETLHGHVVDDEDEHEKEE